MAINERGLIFSSMPFLGSVMVSASVRVRVRGQEWPWLCGMQVAFRSR